MIRSTLYCCILSVFFTFSLAADLYAADISLFKVASPSNLSISRLFPVPINIHFGKNAEEDSFSATLNGKNINHLFSKSSEGFKAYAGPEDGIFITTQFQSKQANTLQIKVQDKKTGQFTGQTLIFFVETDILLPVDKKGALLKRIDFHLSIQIPENALNKQQLIGFSRIAGSGPFDSVYQLSPNNLKLQIPLTATLAYAEKQLPPGVEEKDLLLLHKEPHHIKMENVSVDTLNKRVTGQTRLLTQIRATYLINTGKTYSDIPFANNFRMPIGDISDPLYTCGTKNSVPFLDDKGANIGLLKRKQSQDQSTPVITFNENDRANRWYVQKNVNIPATFDDPQLNNYRESWTFLPKKRKHNRLGVHAIADGLLLSSSEGYGNSVVIAHKTPAGTFLSTYSNLDEKSLCSPGTKIKKGNIIGTIGGLASLKKPRLDFEISNDLPLAITEKGEIKIGDTWFGPNDSSQIVQNFYEPSTFLETLQMKYRWTFNVENHTEGWTVNHKTVTEKKLSPQVKNRIFSMPSGFGELQMSSYPLALAADTFTTIHLNMNSSTLKLLGKIFFRTETDPSYTADKMVSFKIIGSDFLHEHSVAMSKHDKWKGVITGIRLSFSEKHDHGNSQFAIDSIRLGRESFSQLPDSGQDTCFDNLQSIPCPGKGDIFFGQDGNFKTIPRRYAKKNINNDSVLIDHITGLSWQTSTNDSDKKSWDQAMDYAEELTMGGFSDWRLPSRMELQSLVNFNCATSQSEETDSDNTCHPLPVKNAGCYWTSDTRSNLDSQAHSFCPDSYTTKQSNKEEPHYIIAVRGSSPEHGYFKDNGNGTVTDIANDLMWQQNETRPMTWKQALAYSQKLSLAGYQDWRLPTIRELSMLSEPVQEKRKPQTSNYFPGARQDGYWSSTTNTASPSFAWYMNMDDGFEHNGFKDRRYSIKTVRNVHTTLIVNTRPHPEKIRSRKQPEEMKQQEEVPENDFIPEPEGEDDDILGPEPLPFSQLFDPYLIIRDLEIISGTYKQR